MKYLDLETTGFNEDDDVLEYALVNENGNIDIAGRCRSVMKDSWEEAEKIHGISFDDVRGLPSFEWASELIERIASGEEIVIYNKDFDTKYIPRLKDVSDKIHCCMERFADNVLIDGEYKWLKLTDASRIAGYEWVGEPHGAISDAKATRHVWNWLDKVEAGEIRVQGSLKLNVEAQEIQVESMHKDLAIRFGEKYSTAIADKDVKALQVLMKREGFKYSPERALMMIKIVRNTSIEELLEGKLTESEK